MEIDSIKKLLVPFDFSGASKKALDYSVDFIGLRKQMEACLVYVTQDPQEKSLSGDFEELLDGYRIKQQIKWTYAQGSLQEAILKERVKNHIDLIVMGTSGASESDKATNTSELVNASNCPVLSVPEVYPEFRLKNIVLVLGQDEIDEPSALKLLLDISRKFNAKVHVLTVKNDTKMYGYSPIDEKNENTLGYYLESFYCDHVYIENPDVLKGIFDYVSEKEIDMIAILPRNHVKEGVPSKGALTQMLVMHAHVPVLAIN